MALPHAHLLDVIDIHPLGPALHDAVSTSLIKTDRLQLLHLVIPARKDQPERHVDDECTIHCLEGEVELMAGGQTQRMKAGQLVWLEGSVDHALKAIQDVSLLVTIVLRK